MARSACVQIGVVDRLVATIVRNWFLVRTVAGCVGWVGGVFDLAMMKVRTALRCLCDPAAC